jgi:hypothetical protein
LLVAVPALAIVSLGAGVVSGRLTTSASPTSASVLDTRDLARQGENVAAATATAADSNDDAALNQWQNTVRRRPSPRR